MAEADPRYRVAWVSPLPPEKTGIADYSAELLPYLAAAGLAVEGFTADPVASGRSLGPEVPLFRYRDLPERAAGYDALVYHLGNSADYHDAIYDLLQDHPGGVVLHEYLLHHLVQEMTLVRGDLDAYRDEMRYAYGPSGVRAVEQLAAGGQPPDRWRYPLFERAVDSALAVAVHNEHARKRILRSRPAAPVGVLPMAFLAEGTTPASPAVRAAARERLGLPADALVFASFGFVTPVKRTDVVLRAFARVRDRFPSSRYLLVGEVSPHFDLASLLAQGLGEGVTVVGRTSLDDFHRYMLAADVAINLRHPSGGETSATLVRLLGLGLPVVVTDQGSFSEIPDDCCAKVAVDWAEEAVLQGLLERLAEDATLRAALGERARRHVLAEHAPTRSAAAYRRLVEQAMRARESYRPPPPPLAAYPATDLGSDLARAAGAALADLGLGERDEGALRDVARAFVDLGLDRAW